VCLTNPAGKKIAVPTLRHLLHPPFFLRASCLNRY
jgi:hypothetical protein